MGSGVKELKSQWAAHIELAKWLVDEVKPKITVDLGTYQGASAIALASNNNGRVVTIDKKQPAKYTKVIKELMLNIEILKGEFDKFVDTFKDHSIDIIHLDGDHRLDAVMNDVEKWLPKLTQNGIFLMHDVWNPAFYGPLLVFCDGLKGYKFMAPTGAGLGISSMNKNLMVKMWQQFPYELVGCNIFNSLKSYSERKNIWIKGLSESFARDRVLSALKEKTDLLSATHLSE